MSYPVVWIVSPTSPADLSFARTAVIASAFSRCASRDVRARDSAAIETNARSGARLTTASPVTTTTERSGAGPAGVCAPATVAQTSAPAATRAIGISMAVVLLRWIAGDAARARVRPFCSIRAIRARPEGTEASEKIHNGGRSQRDVRRRQGSRTAARPDDRGAAGARTDTSGCDPPRGPGLHRTLLRSSPFSVLHVNRLPTPHLTIDSP